jgi:hypothetical protein
MDCQHGIEEVGKADALGFRDESEQVAVPVERPGQALFDYLKRSFIVVIEQTVADSACGGDLEGKLYSAVTKPLDADHLD